MIQEQPMVDQAPRQQALAVRHLLHDLLARLGTGLSTIQVLSLTALHHLAHSLGVVASWSLNLAIGQLKHVTGAVWTVVHWITQWLGGLCTAMIVNPTMFAFKVFRIFYKLIIVPIFYFSLAAGALGILAGIIVGAGALLVQMIIPVERKPAVRKPVTPPSRREHSHRPPRARNVSVQVSLKPVAVPPVITASASIGGGSTIAPVRKEAALRQDQSAVTGIVAVLTPPGSPKRKMAVLDVTSSSVSTSSVATSSPQSTRKVRLSVGFTTPIDPPRAEYEDEDGYSFKWSGSGSPSTIASSSPALSRCVSTDTIEEVDESDDTEVESASPRSLEESVDASRYDLFNPKPARIARDLTPRPEAYHRLAYRADPYNSPTQAPVELAG